MFSWLVFVGGVVTHVSAKDVATLIGKFVKINVGTVI